MEKVKMVHFNIDDDLAEKFDLALKLNKENSDEVITRLMIEYVSDSFSKASKAFTVQPPVRSNYLSDEDGNYAKANRKIPVWALKPQQNNHRIIKAFFEIEEEQGFVSIDELANRCSNSTDYPDTLSTDFKGNFAQMKTDASNSHGKVFVVNDGIVEVWDEIKEVLIQSKPLFIKNLEGGYGFRIMKKRDV